MFVILKAVCQVKRRGIFFCLSKFAYDNYSFSGSCCTEMLAVVSSEISLFADRCPNNIIIARATT